VHYDFSQFGLDRSQSLFFRNLRTSLIVDPANGKIPPLTEEGKRRTAQRAEEQKKLGGRWDSAESNQLDDRCLIMAGPGPPMMDAAYNSNYHIVQSSGVVMILTEMIHDVRIVTLDGRPQPDAKVRQWMGVSRGRWEGETLVVETTNFNGKNPFRGSDENLKVIERFTRLADDTIEYKFTIDDPTMWTRPWTAESAMKKTGRADLRARVPRRELRSLQHAGRCQARREASGGRSTQEGLQIMRNRLLIGTTLALMAGWLLPVLTNVAAQAPASPAYRAPRTPDGKPNLNGIWQTMNTANWNIEAHPAGPSPARELGAAWAVPAGLGVVDGGEIRICRPRARSSRRTTRTG
jgi:hypothetical protein